MFIILTALLQLAQSKWLVTALFCSIILLRHDAKSLWAAIGSVTNVMLSTALKRILNQERPTSALKSDPGMPSSHAQSIFYTITFLNLSSKFYLLNFFHDIVSYTLATRHTRCEYKLQSIASNQ